ncbi:MAG: shikimate dehydrogenase [Planktomarina sp.]|nr:shikimate dehydrogenase [Planktomarina sp.]
MNFILASQSLTRFHALKCTGLDFDTVSAKIDEESVSRTLLSDKTPHRDIADTLAEYKAKKISNKWPDSLVLGCDQVLSLENQILEKPHSQIELRENLEKIAGKRHQLITANVIYKERNPIWRHIAVSHLTMVSMNSQEIDSLSQQSWNKAQHSSANYCFEEIPYMFLDVCGNWFDILGVSVTEIVNFINQSNYTARVKVPKIVALLGSPISHSKSPLMHKHWLSKNRISGDYVAIDVPKKELSNAVRALTSVGLSGFNVTLPHKQEALTIANKKTRTANKIGAANTLVVDKNSIITADNTDGYGFITNLQLNSKNWVATSGSALVLGSGGAARAVLFSLLEAGVPKIYLSNRTKARSIKLAKKLSTKIQVVDWDSKEDYLSEIVILVNTTSLGMKGKPPLSLDLSSLNPKTLVTDLVYSPLETKLLREAKAIGCDVVGGIGMLIYQGVPGFKEWFGTTPKVDGEIMKLVTK